VDSKKSLTVVMDLAPIYGLLTFVGLIAAPGCDDGRVNGRFNGFTATSVFMPNLFHILNKHVPVPMRRAKVHENVKPLHNPLPQSTTRPHWQAVAPRTGSHSTTRLID